MDSNLIPHYVRPRPILGWAIWEVYLSKLKGLVNATVFEQAWDPAANTLDSTLVIPFGTVYRQYTCINCLP